MGQKHVIEDKQRILRALEVVTPVYILKATKQAQNSIENSKPLGSHSLSLSFGTLYLCFWTLVIRLPNFFGGSLKYSRNVLPIGFEKGLTALSNTLPITSGLKD